MLYLNSDSNHIDLHPPKPSRWRLGLRSSKSLLLTRRLTTSTRSSMLQKKSRESLCSRSSISIPGLLCGASSTPSQLLAGERISLSWYGTSTYNLRGFDAQVNGAMLSVASFRSTFGWVIACYDSTEDSYAAATFMRESPFSKPPGRVHSIPFRA